MISEKSASKIYTFTIMRGFFVVWLFISLGSVSAQDVPQSYTIMDEEVRHAWDLWLEENSRSATTRVWRVLVVGVESRRVLDREVEKFKREYPDLSYDWSYDAPFYKLKVGATQKRLAIKPLLYQIRASYPSALEIRDEIEIDRYFELNRYDP